MDRYPFSFDGSKVAQNIAGMLNEIAEHTGAKGDITADFKSPDVEEVKECFRRNCTVWGTLTLSHVKDGLCKSIEIPVLYPYHGVFVTGNGNGRFDRPAEARLMVWRPCLARRTGFWLLRSLKEVKPPDRDTEGQEPESGNTVDDHVGEKINVAELGMFANSSISTKDISKAEKKLEKEKQKKQKKKGRNDQRQLHLPSLTKQTLEDIKKRISVPSSEFDRLQDFLLKARNMMLDQEGIVTALKLMERVLKLAPDWDGGYGHIFTDSEDLATRRLYTYEVYLAERTVELICNRWLSQDGVIDNSYWSKAEGFKLGRVIQRWLTNSGRKGYEWLRPLESGNAAETVSSLTAISRFGWGKAPITNLPPPFRQNHHSFKGVICPVQTPESDMIGLSLHLAADVSVDKGGILTAKAGSAGLGYTASLLPFYHHTDAARAMMGAKNYVQALRLENSEPPLVKTGCEAGVRDALEPLTAAGLLPEEDNFFSPGVDLVVAYMPWYGLNYNDAIVANSLLGERMAFYRTRHFVERLRPGEKFLCVEWFSTNGLPLVNETVSDRTPIAVVTCATGTRTIRCGASGLLVSVLRRHSQEGIEYGGTIEWTVQERHILDVGDKLMGRHGNKGVISRLLPPGEMPRLPKDERLGKLSGRAVDLVLNPLGVISRMNIGQLLESHLGLLLKLGVEGVPEDMGRPFAKVDTDLIQKLLFGINGGGTPVVDGCGRMYLTIPGIGGQPEALTQAPVVVGVQYFVRLDQLPSNKANFRGSGLPASSYDRGTLQPKGGRSRNGGQKLGYMEMWALDAYQSRLFLNRALTDAYRPNGDEKSQEPISQTFRAIKDGLFAMGIILEPEESTPENYSLRWSDDSEIEGRGMEVKYAGTPATRIAVKGAFVCPECGGKTNDDWGSDQDQKTGVYRLCVEDILREKGVTLTGCDYEAALPEGESELKTSKDCPAVTVRLPVKGHLDFTVGGQPYHAYRRIDNNVLNLSFILGMRIRCPDHKNAIYSCINPEEFKTVKTMGGLADPNVFRDDTFSWGYIRLPKEFPAKDLLGGWAKSRPAFNVIPVLPWRYRESLPLEDGTQAPSYLTRLYQTLALEAQKFTCTKDKAREKDFDKALKALFNHLLERMEKKEGLIRKAGFARRVDNSGRFVVIPDPDLQWDECAITVATYFESTLGYWDDEDIKSMTARGGRHYKIDVSEENEAARIQQEESDRHRSGMTEDEYAEFIAEYESGDVHPDITDTIVIVEYPLGGTQSQNAISKYLKSDNNYVLVNRQPSLHRYNIKALRVNFIESSKSFTCTSELNDCLEERLRPSDTTLIIAVNPLICRSMGLDFDGDDMAVHMVARDDAEEAKRLLPTDPSNLLSVASGDPVAEFEQDAVLGTFLISRDDDLRSEFCKAILAEGCICCNKIAEDADWNAKTCCDLMRHLCEQHPDDVTRRIEKWTKMAFDTVTRKGVSFGFFDLLACSPEGIEDLIAKAGNDDVPATEDINESLTEAVESRMKEILATRDPKEPGFSVAAMAVSGARGDKQVRQLVAARGFLSPGGICFEAAPERFIFKESLCSGMSPETSFFAAMNGRSTMTDKKLSTRSAGHLTNLMVTACWPWRIKEGDCGSENHPRSPATCGWATDKAICAACYGRLPDGSLPKEGYPAGLVAAQSIGERGTQLSMKGFHTGTTAVAIGVIMSWMSKKMPWFDGTPLGLAKFTEALKETDAYKSIGGQHIELLWRVISLSPERSLLSAVKAVCRSDVFAALIGPQQWSSLSSIMNSKPPIASLNSGIVPSILIGHPGRLPEGSVVTSDIDGGDDTSDIDGGDGNQDADDGEGMGFDGEEQTGDPNESDQTEDISTDLPADRTVISLVVVKSGDSLGCRVEFASKNDQDFKLYQMARALANWKSEKWQDLLVTQRKETALFSLQDDMVEAFNKLPGMPKFNKTDASRFVSRAVIFWPSSHLPVKDIFSDNRFFGADQTLLPMEKEIPTV